MNTGILKLADCKWWRYRRWYLDEPKKRPYVEAGCVCGTVTWKYFPKFSTGRYDYLDARNSYCYDTIVNIRESEYLKQITDKEK